MITFYTTMDVSSLNIEKLLALPFMIEEVELEIGYSISKYHAATFWSPEEGGEIEDCNFKIINIITGDGYVFFAPTDKQCLTVEKAFTEKERSSIDDAIWHHHDTNKSEPDDWCW
jgi:hypothetical protein